MCKCDYAHLCAEVSVKGRVCMCDYVHTCAVCVSMYTCVQVCDCVHVCRFLGRPEASGPLVMKLQETVNLQEGARTELRVSRRTAHDLKY